MGDEELHHVRASVCSRGFKYISNCTCHVCVGIVDCTHVNHVDHYTKSDIAILLLLRLYQCRVSYSLSRTRQQWHRRTLLAILQIFVGGSVTASFGLITVSEEHELYKPYSKTKRRSIVWLKYRTHGHYSTLIIKELIS